MDRIAPQPEALLGWMESLADSTRLRLLRLLERHELGVVQLCDILQLPQSTVSRHLKLLSDHDWLRSHRQGTNNLYRLTLDELEPPSRRLWLLAREQTDEWATVSQDRLRLTRLLREKQQGGKNGRDSREFFAGAAGQWDKLRGELYGDGFSTAAMLALLPADALVADLGCGTGRVTAELSPYVGKVIGVDNSAAMLKAARKRTTGLSNVDLRPGDLEALPLSAGECDAALLLLALTYVPEPALVLKEVARVLKPGGKVVIVDLLPHDRDDFRRQMDQQSMGISSEKIERIVRDAGFEETRLRPLPPEPAAKGPALFIAVAIRQLRRA